MTVKDSELLREMVELQRAEIEARKRHAEELRREVTKRHTGPLPSSQWKSIAFAVGLIGAAWGAASYLFVTSSRAAELHTAISSEAKEERALLVPRVEFQAHVKSNEEDAKEISKVLGRIDRNQIIMGERLRVKGLLKGDEYE